MFRNSGKRGGYVLVLTLGLIAIATISLAGIARFSLGLAASARQAEDDLQHRWGMLSVRHVLLDRADWILESQVQEGHGNLPPWPKRAQVAASFTLGNHHFQVVVADEDAKADVNTIQARKRQRTLSAIRELSGDTVLDIRLSPSTGGKTPFDNWGQVFDLASATTSNAHVAAELRTASDELSCWGSGQLNLRRANDDVVREIAGLVLPAPKVAELIDCRQSWGGQGAEELLDELELRRPQYLAARRLLGVESHSHSLWIEVSSGQRDWSYVCVDDGKSQCFAW